MKKTTAGNEPGKATKALKLAGAGKGTRARELAAVLEANGIMFVPAPEQPKAGEQKVAKVIVTSKSQTEPIMVITPHLGKFVSEQAFTILLLEDNDKAFLKRAYVLDASPLTPEQSAANIMLIALTAARLGCVAAARMIEDLSGQSVNLKDVVGDTNTQES
jgi:hypothetical protein